MPLSTLRMFFLAGLAAPFIFLSFSAHAQTGSPQASWTAFGPQDESLKPQAQPGAAKLILLRPISSQDTPLPADILVDGRYLTSLLPGGFAEVDVCPGIRQLELAGQGTSGLSFRPRLALNAATDRINPVWVQAPNADKPLSSELSAEQAAAMLQGLRRQTHAISRVPPPLNCTTAAAEPQPAVTQVTPPPPPAAPPSTSPSAPPLRKFTLSAEMLFAFGGSKPMHLAERGRKEIIDLAQQLQAELQPTERVLVQGHTDPMGSNTLNQRLSAERADTVRSILLSQGLPARQVIAQGLGSSQLLVKDCAKRHAQRDNRIFCDLPNRRVEITVAPLKN